MSHFSRADCNFSAMSKSNVSVWSVVNVFWFKVSQKLFHSNFNNRWWSDRKLSQHATQLQNCYYNMQTFSLISFTGVISEQNRIHKFGMGNYESVIITWHWFFFLYFSSQCYDFKNISLGWKQFWVIFILQIHCYMRFSTNIEAWAKWLTFCRQHFQMYVLQWKSFYLNSNYNKLYQKDQLTFTLNVRGQSYLGLTGSISWLLMPWRRKEPGHQQPWHWLCRVGRSFSYLRKDFNNLCHINVEEWNKM